MDYRYFFLLMTVTPANAFEIEQCYINLDSNPNNIDTHILHPNNTKDYNNNTVNELEQSIHENIGEGDSSSIIHIINVISLIILALTLAYNIYITCRYFSTQNYITTFNERYDAINQITDEMEDGYMPTNGELDFIMDPTDPQYYEAGWHHQPVTNQWTEICEWCPAIYTSAMALHREMQLQSFAVYRIENRLGSMKSHMYSSWGVLGIFTLISTTLFLIDYYYTNRKNK